MTMNLDLESFAGAHILSGAEPGYRNEKTWYGDEGVSILTFILNGKTYTAVEDPSDGYRSSLDHIEEGGECGNIFAGQPVIATYGESQPDYFEGLTFVSSTTGKEILRLGTSNYDDYYPNCVLEFLPQNLDANADVSTANQGE